MSNTYLTESVGRFIDKMMNKLKNIRLSWQNADTIDALKNDLRENNISITSTDTVLGFLANANKFNFVTLCNLKGKRQHKPFVVLIEHFLKLEAFVDVSSLDLRLQAMLKECWPGPVTVVFQARPGCASFLTSQQGTIALRCPDHVGLRKLLASFDGLFSTSANKTGQLVPLTIDQIDKDILEYIEYLVVDEDSDKQKVTPSTILDCSDLERGVRVLREGEYPIKKLEGYYGEPFKK